MSLRAKVEQLEEPFKKNLEDLIDKIDKDENLANLAEHVAEFHTVLDKLTDQQKKSLKEELDVYTTNLYFKLGKNG